MDQFCGVPESLRELGLDTLYERLWSKEVAWGGHAHPCVIKQANVVACADLTHNGHARVIRLAQQLAAPSVLLVDGVVEWANVMMNPWLGFQHLRPAPEDVVLCSGPLHRDILGAMGNHALATGLPRLTGFASDIVNLRAQADDSGPPQVLIATANFPAGSKPARQRIMPCLFALRDAMRTMPCQPVWRLTAGLCDELDVKPDTQPLDASLARAHALITTASTIAIEGMLARTPTCVLHPHPWPLWVPAAWRWTPAPLIDAEEMRGVERRLVESANACEVAQNAIDRALQGVGTVVESTSQPLTKQAANVIDSLLSPTQKHLEAQNRLLALMHVPDASQRVARALADVSARNDRALDATNHKTPTPIEPIGPTIVRTHNHNLRTVVSIIVSRSWPAHAITTWSHRLGRTFTNHPEHGYCFHTLHVATAPENYSQTGAPYDEMDSRQHIVTLELTDSAHTRLARIVEALEKLDPDIVIPNEGDLALAACAQLRSKGTKTVVVAHNDAWSMHDDLGVYDRWNAMVFAGPHGAAAPSWLTKIARGSDISHIPYGVPILTDRTACMGVSPLKIGFVGTIIQDRRRVFDLIDLLDALNRREVGYEFHLVGDGPDLTEWVEKVQSDEARASRVTVHGRLDSAQMERFLAELDISVLVSEREGASVAMLEAMGAGVAPCITTFGSGLAHLIRDGVDGIVTPVGDMELMADRIAHLAAHTDDLCALSQSVCARVRDLGLGVDRMVERYAQVFDAVIAAPRDRRPSDLGVRLHNDEKVIRHPDDPIACDEWLRNGLMHGGYRRLAFGRPTLNCDAVLVRAADSRPEASEIDAWRASGLGVAVSPNLCIDKAAVAVERLIGDVYAEGNERIALCAAPGHTQRVARWIEHGHEPRVVGFIDRVAQPGDSHMGLPAWSPERAIAELRPDAVILVGGAAEAVLFRTCQPIVEQGVRIYSVDVPADDLPSCAAVIDELSEDAALGKRVTALTDRGSGDFFASALGQGVEVIEISDPSAPAREMAGVTGDVLGVLMAAPPVTILEEARAWQAAGGVLRMHQLRSGRKNIQPAAASAR